MTLVAPGVPSTAVVTAPFESSVSAWPEASAAPPSTIFLNVARVPDDAGRRIRTIFMSGPPTSFQFVVTPVQIFVAWSVVRFVTTDQATKIWTGVTTNWKDVGGPDMKIVLILRPASSGTRATFKKIVLGGAAEASGQALTEDSNGAVTTAVE